MTLSFIKIDNYIFTNPEKDNLVIDINNTDYVDEDVMLIYDSKL